MVGYMKITQDEAILVIKCVKLQLFEKVKEFKLKNDLSLKPNSVYSEFMIETVNLRLKKISWNLTHLSFANLLIFVNQKEKSM